MQLKTSLLSTVAFVLGTVASLVRADCTLGNNVEPTIPLVTSGQFINIDRPAECHGNITAWHFCYYPSSISTPNATAFAVWFRIWRPAGGNSYQLVYNFRNFGISVQRRDSIECETIEAQNVTVQPGDVVGIYMRDIRSTVSALAYDPPEEQAGVYMDTRDDSVQLLSVGIQRRNLLRRNNIGLHLYATISVPDVPSQPPQQSTEKPTARVESMSEQLLQATTTEGNNDQSQDGGSNNKGAVAAAVIIVLLIVVAAVVVTTVFLLCYLKRKNISINCIKGKSGAMIAFDNLLYRAASERIPVKVPKRKTKTKAAKTDNTDKYPYDIPRDHHNRALYDIPRSSLSSSANYEVVGKPDSELTRSYATNTEAESGADVTTTTRVAIVESTVCHERPPGDDLEYIYMEDTSEKTDTIEQESDSSSVEDYIHLTYASVQYKKLLKQATEDSNDLGDKESPYHAPPDKEEEIYVVLSRQRIKVIPRGSIQTTDHLGSGQFGNVEKGVWKGSRGTISVAIKTLEKKATEEDKIRLLQEAVNMGQFTHPNIVQLHGVVTNGEPLMLVMEYLPKGDLKKFLAHIRPLPGQLAMASTPKLLLGFSQQIALGMHYLATKGYIHRDIAARNIFLTDEHTCKIGDFGMSRELADDTVYYKGHGGKVPLKWMAPEAINLKKYSIASDVWSYGCVLYEIWSLGLRPFKGLSNKEAVRKVTDGYRLPPPPGCPKAIYTLMIQCWHTVASTRPKYRSILTTLLEDENNILSVPVDDASTHPDAAVLGGPVEAGEKMYLDLQSTYLPDASDKYNPDYEFVRDTDNED